MEKTFVFSERFPGDHGLWLNYIECGNTGGYLCHDDFARALNMPYDAPAPREVEITVSDEYRDGWYECVVTALEDHFSGYTPDGAICIQDCLYAFSGTTIKFLIKEFDITYPPEHPKDVDFTLYFKVRTK